MQFQKKIGNDEICSNKKINLGDVDV
jgi:hypothetical protein